VRQLIVFGLTAVVLFGLSAAGSYLYQQWQRAKHAETESSKAAEGKPAEPPATTQGSGPPIDKAPVGEEPARLSSASPTAEAARLAREYEAKLRNLKEREQALEAKRQRLLDIVKDIQEERKEVDQLRKQIANELKAVEDRMNEVDRRRGEVEQERAEIAARIKELKESLVEVEGLERDNVKKMGAMYDAMEPASAALILQQMSDSGKMDTAVKILATMQPAKAARVLAEMPQTLSAQLMDKIRVFKQPPKKTAASGP
jgi:flagellar motility protein MotE (MotC chaperone)